MIYADYSFYRDVFLGVKISEEDFPRYAARASERIDFLTFNRIKDVTEEVKKACCAAAECFCNYDKVPNFRGISSEKVGDYSVGYASAEEIRKAAEKSAASAIREYLLHTGLLCKAVGV